MELAPETLVLGRYVVERLIAEGGMGEVYQARHQELGSRVALKLLKPEALTDPDAVARFRREAQIAAGLSSPHIARVLDVGSLAGGEPVMVMELLDGRDLAQELELRGPLPIDEALRWVLQATEAMIDAHRAGIVHRDLKPGNLYLAEQAGSRTLKVLDFGISRFSAPGLSRMTQTQSAFGTPLYMSPEQIRSAKLADERSDVWSMGVILYELCTGTLPFIAETPTALAVVINVEQPLPMSAHRPGSIPAELEALVSACLVKDPSQRIQSMDDLAQGLRALLRPAGQGSTALPRAGRDVVAAAGTGTEAGSAAMEARTSADLGPREALGAQPRSPSRAALVVALAALVGVGLSLGALAWMRGEGAGPGVGASTSTTAARDPEASSSAGDQTGELAVSAPRVVPEASVSASASIPSATTPSGSAVEASRPAGTSVRPRAPTASASPPSAPSVRPTATQAPSGPAAPPRAPDANPLHL